MGLITAIYKEAERRDVDLSTWHLLNKFWASSDPIHPAILEPARDRVALLEKRMLDRHGWKPQCKC